MEPPAEIDQLRAMLAERDATIALQANTIRSLTAKVEALEALVKKLVEELSRNSSNSNLPPSSDGPGGSSPKAGKKPNKKGRKRGGQPGHKGSHRVLVPAEQVHEAVDMFPARCDNCHEALPKTLDPDPTRHQYIELAPLLPHVTEFRRHEGKPPTGGMSAGGASACILSAWRSVTQRTMSSDVRGFVPRR